MTGVFADSNRVSIRYIAESVSAWGVTPVSGNVREMRLTSSSLAASKDTKVSNELRADRMVSTIVETGAMTEGDVNFEWSAGTFDDFIQAFVLGTWTRPMTFDRWIGEIVSITANNTIKVLGKDVRPYILAGRYIKTEGFTVAENNNYWLVTGTSLSGSDTLIAISGTPLTVESGSFYTKVMDANDVIIFKNNDIRSGTGGADAFDSNGNNAFSAAITAGQLVVGQNIFVEGLGRESGTVLFNDVSEVGDTITISDGVDSYAFVAGTDFAVGASASDSATAFTAAVNAKRVIGDLAVIATRATATVTIKNLLNDGGSIVETSDTWETGSVAFGGTATADDAITIDDNINTPIQYVAKASGAGVHEFNIGASATDSAQNLKDAIDADILSGALSNITTSGASTTITIKSSTGGGSIAEDVDFGTVITVVDFVADDNTTVTDFANGDATVRGMFTITELTNDVITVDRNVGTINNSTIDVTIKGSMLRNPGDIDDIIPQSFSMETAYNDIGQYFTQNGLRVGTFNLNINSGAICTGSMSFNGKETFGDNEPVLGDDNTYTLLESTITEVMNATDNVGTIKKNGETLVNAIQQIQLKGNASLRNQMAVSSKFPRGIGTGRFQLTGSFTAYFEDRSFWDDFIQHNTVSLSWDMNDIETNTYVFTVPALKILTDPIGPGGIDQDVVEEMNFNAFRDANTECMLQIDRFSSVNPV